MARQYNIVGLNGLYLTVRPSQPVDSSNYLSEMIRNTDFFPKSDSNRSSLGFLLSKSNANYQFKNAQFNGSSANISGSNSLVKANSAVPYSEIVNQNQLILNEPYYNKFVFHFNFAGAVFNGYTPSPSINAFDFKHHMSKIRVKLYVQLGSNIIPLKLSDLQYFHNEGLGATWNSAYSGSLPVYWEPTNKYGFRLNTGENGEDCIDLGQVLIGSAGIVNIIAERMGGVDVPPGGYTYRCTAEIPDFDTLCRGNKDYKLIVRYYNIKISDVTGVSLSTSPYNTDEAVEMMAQNYVWYKYVDPYLFNGGGGGPSPGPIFGP